MEHSEKQFKKPSTPYPIDTWYSKPEVQELISNICLKREIAFGDPDKKVKMSRHWQSNHPTQINFLLTQHYMFGKEKLRKNMYMSINKYKWMPKRYKTNDPTRNWWENESNGFIGTVEWWIDIDASSHNDIYKAQYQAIECYRDLQAIGYDPYVQFSGMGFHIMVTPFIIDFEDWELIGRFNKGNIWNLIKRKMKAYKRDYSLIDMAIYDDRRLIKCPFTVVRYEDEHYMCWPLTKQELYDFKLENYSLKNIDRFIELIGTNEYKNNPLIYKEHGEKKDKFKGLF